MNIITLQNISDPTEIKLYGSLTRLCRNHPEFSYHYLKRLKYPFESHGWTFRKIPFN